MAEEGAVFGRIADQNTADQTRALGVEQELLVDPSERVLVGQGPGAVGFGQDIAEAGDVHAHQLELGGRVEAGEHTVGAGQVRGDNVGHLVAGGHQAMDRAPMQGDLADRQDVRVAGPQDVIDDDAPPRADLQPAGAGQLVAGADPSRDDDHVDLQPVAVGKRQALHLAVAEKLLGALVEVDPDPQTLDLVAERPGACLVNLAGHQPWRELDHVGLEVKVEDRLGGLQPQQAATDHRRPRRRAGVGEDPLQVLDRAVDENPLLIHAGNPRDKRGRTSRQYDRVVRDLPPPFGNDDPSPAVDHLGPVADMKGDAVFGIPLLGSKLEVAGVPALEVLRQVHSVVSGARLLAEGHDLIALVEVVFHQPLAEPVAHHSIADHDDGLALTIPRDHSSPLPIEVVETSSGPGIARAGSPGLAPHRPCKPAAATRGRRRSQSGDWSNDRAWAGRGVLAARSE